MSMTDCADGQKSTCNKQELDTVEAMLSISGSGPLRIAEPFRNLFLYQRTRLLLLSLLAHLFQEPIPTKASSEWLAFTNRVSDCLRPCLEAACPTWRSGQWFDFNSSGVEVTAMVYRFLSILSALALPFKSEWQAARASCYPPPTVVPRASRKRKHRWTEEEVITVYVASCNIDAPSFALCIVTTSNTSRWNNGLGLVVLATLAGNTCTKNDAELVSVLAATAILKKHAVHHKTIVFYVDADLTSPGCDRDRSDNRGAIYMAIGSLAAYPFNCHAMLGRDRKSPFSVMAARATAGYARRASTGQSTWLNCTPGDATPCV